MTYEIVWELNSHEELDKLPKDVALRILDKIEEAAENPEHYLIRLESMPEYKIRAGHYRVLLLLDAKKKMFKIHAIGHRRNIYKKYVSE